MCGLHHMKLRLASIIVTENELMPEIHIPDEKLHEPSFVTKYFDRYAFSIEMIAMPLKITNCLTLLQCRAQY